MGTQPERHWPFAHDSEHVCSLDRNTHTHNSLNVPSIMPSAAPSTAPVVVVVVVAVKITNHDGGHSLPTEYIYRSSSLKNDRKQLVEHFFLVENSLTVVLGETDPLSQDKSAVVSEPHSLCL
jgi:hypothetical protein